MTPQDIQNARTAAVAGRSYTTAAVVTFIAYLFFWIPGVIINFMYLNSAKQTEALIGHAPDGIGVLKVMIWVFCYIPIILAVLVVLALLLAHH
jgi:hypothetical protein